MTTPPINPALFYLDPDHLWLQHCADGPVPRGVARCMQDFLQKEFAPWQLRWEEDFLGIAQTCRELTARVIEADPADISLTANTSTGLQTLAQALHWKAGDEVVAPLGEFPSNVWPWKALAPRGVSFLEVPLWDGHRSGARAWESAPPPADVDPEARLMRFVRSGSRVLAVSWVRFQDGLKLDLARLGKACRERDSVLIVDGIQGAGTAVPDLTGVSAFVSGCHKGLLAPQGAGFLWTRADFRRHLLPTGTWLSVTDATTQQRAGTDFINRAWVTDGRRLEPGGSNLLGCVAFSEALRALHAAGIPAIAAHAQALQQRLLETMELRGIWLDEVKRLRGLLDRGRLGSILAFHHGGRGPAALQEMLDRGQRRGIYASVREGYLRIAFHGWHELTDIDRIVEWLDA